MGLPLFSIIIPTYNSAQTLKVCLDSLLGQTYNNFEIIIIDGNSTDGTIEIIKNYSSLNPFLFKWISEKDKGIYDAMNKGIKLAKAEWLYFLGSDDKVFDTELLKQIVSNISNGNKVDVFYGNVTSLRFSGIYDGEFTNEKIFQKNICHQSIFFSKNVFKKIGNFNLKYRVHADWDHNLRWFLSKNITKVFVNITCAEYADGGFSSINEDLLFENEKKWKYLIFNHKNVSNGYKYLITKNILQQCFQNRDILKLFSILYYCPQIYID